MELIKVEVYEQEYYPPIPNEVDRKATVVLDREINGWFGIELHRITFDIAIYNDGKVECDLYELTIINGYDKKTELSRRYLDDSEIGIIDILAYALAVEKLKSHQE